MRRAPPPIHRIEVVDETIAQILRKKTIAERVAVIGEANRAMRLLIEGGIRTQHQSWSDEQVKREVARRMLLGTH